VAGQPDTLTKASLEDCLADAFHPGCEMTWPVRTATMFMAPFRFLHVPEGWIEPQFAPPIDSALSLPNGPLAAQGPGGITRWMAVPWQTDTASCRSGYTRTYDPYVPTFWPARVPNNVLTEENYRKVMNEKLPLGERLAAFATRSLWIRPLGKGSYTDQINNMVDHFGKLGVVEVRKGPRDRENFPAEIEVEQLHPADHQQRLLKALADTEAAPAPADSDQDIDLTGIEKVNRFPHGLSQRR
jgi:hypothetical protein